MRGKHGFLKIVEAFVAIMIIAGVMGYIYVQRIQKPSQAEALNQLENIILAEITKTEELRNAVLNGDSLDLSEAAEANRTLINNVIKKYISQEYEYDFKICDLNAVCQLDTYQQKEVVANYASVSSTLTQYGPKKIRIFMWRKD